MTTARKVVLMLVILAAVLVTVPSAVAGFDVPNNGGWEYTDDDSSSATQVEDIYIEEKEETVLFGADIGGSSQKGLDGDTLQVYIDTDQGETGKQESSSGFYAGLEPISADYRVSVSDGGLPIIQEYDDEDGLYEFIEGIEYKEKGDIAVVEVEKETIDNPEVFSVKFAHIYGSGVGSDDYNWLPENDIESYQINDENTNITERKTATINVNPTFSEPLDDASLEVELTDDSGEIVDTKTRDSVNTSSLTVPFTDVDPDSFNDSGEASAEVIVEDDEEFVVNGDIENTAAIDTNLGDNASVTVDNLDFSYIKSNVTFRDSDDPDSVTFILKDDDGNISNRDGNTDTNPVSETFTVNSNNFDNGEGTLSIAVEGDRPYPNQSKDVPKLNDPEDIDFDLSDVSHEFTVENPSLSTLDVGKSTPEDEFTVEISVESDNSGSNITQVTHVVDFDERINENQINVDFKSPFDNGLKYDTNWTVDSGEIEIEMYSIGGGNIVDANSTDTLANITFGLEDVDSIKQNIDQGDENSESLTINTNRDSELLNTTDELSYTSSDADVEIKNSQTRLTGADVTHITDDGDMVGAPIKIDVEVETNDGELDKIELLDGDGNNRSYISCEDESTCGEDATLEYTPNNASVGTPDGYGAREHRIQVTTNSSDTYNLSEEFDSIEDSDLEMVVYAKGDVNRDGPSKPKTVRRSDVSTVIENRGEESGGLPWEDDELARADVNNDGTIDINDITSIISVYNPAEGTVEFSNDPLDVNNDQVDINISDLNNNINETVDVIIVNNDGDQTEDITTGNNSDLTNVTGQSVNIDTTNVDSGDELEVQIHEVNDPAPDAAGGNPVDTATENVKISPAFDSAEVTDSNADQLRVTFDADVSASAATGFSVTSDGTAINVDSFNTVENSNTVVLNLDRTVVSTESLTATYDGSGDVTSSVDTSDAETFSGETVTNSVL